MRAPASGQEADVVLTSSGGYPLDATFYQCVKAMVSCLPAVRKGGVILTVGGCSEGVGGSAYRRLMHRYAGRWKAFLTRAHDDGRTRRDQWQLPMQTRPLKHVGDDHLIFATDGLPVSELNRLNVRGVRASEGRLRRSVQALLDGFMREGRSLAVIPEGPYCAPSTERMQT